MAYLRVAFWQASAALSLVIGVVVSEGVYGSGLSVGVSMPSTTPSVSAAEAVTILKVEPGG